jgi:DNA repair exonuclease SbcCD nuclease subunit
MDFDGRQFVLAPWGTTLEKLKELRQGLVDPKSILITHLGTTLEGKHWTEIAGEIGNINLVDLKALNFQAVLLGHYHGQTDLGQNIWYPGSPECYNFGEADQTKGYLIWEITDKGIVMQICPITDGPIFKTFTVEEFLDYRELGFSGYVKIQGDASEEQKALIIERLQTFKCEDYKLDLQSTLKVKRTFALKGKSNIEILINYLESKEINAEAIPALIELDQDMEEYVRL